jgi:hypothetical protein
MASEAKNKNKNSKVKVILRIEAETTSFFSNFFRETQVLSKRAY